jgi:hypothetical protein
MYTVAPGDITVAARDIGGWAQTPLVEADGMEIFFPRWSNAGDRIAYIRDSRLWVVGADGGDPHQVRTRDWVNIASPCWSPDDRTLVVLHTDIPGSFVEFQETASALFIDVATEMQVAEVPVPRISGILSCSWQRRAP